MAQRYVVVVTSGETPTVLGSFIETDRADEFADRVRKRLEPLNARGGNYHHCFVVPLETPTIKNAMRG